MNASVPLYPKLGTLSVQGVGQSVARRGSSGLLGQRLRAFWTAPVTAQPLAWFRIGLAGVLLVQALALLGHLDELYGRHGVVAWSVTWAGMPPAVPNLAWLDRALGSLRAPAACVVPLAFACYVGGLVGLLVGYRTRLAAGLAWLAHTALLTSGEMSAYGVDRFAQIGLFYCVWFPVGAGLSLARPAARFAAPTFSAWLGLRMLQAHVCIVYVATGLEKAVGEQWWNGEALWRALMGAGGPFDCSFLAWAPWLARGLCWLTLLFEAGVVAFVWQTSLRKLWLVGIIGMHVCIAVLMNLWAFSAILIVFDVAAFGISGHPPTPNGQAKESLVKEVLHA